MKHTHGKWIVVNENTIVSEDTHIARFDLGKTGTPYIELMEEEKANGKLIAAAPDLLEALKLAKMSLKEMGREAYEHSSIGATIDAAIKKATS